MASSGAIVEALSTGVGFNRSSVAVCLRLLRDAGHIRTGARGINAVDLTPTEVTRLLVGATSPIAVGAAEAVQTYVPLPLHETRGDRHRPAFLRWGWLPDGELGHYRRVLREIEDYTPLAALQPGDDFGSAIEMLLAYFIRADVPPELSERLRSMGVEGEGVRTEIILRLRRPVPIAFVECSWRAWPGGLFGGQRLFRKTYRFGDSVHDEQHEYIKAVEARERGQHWGSEIFLNENAFEVIAAAMREPRSSRSRIGRQRRS